MKKHTICYHGIVKETSTTRIFRKIFFSQIQNYTEEIPIIKNISREDCRLLEKVSRESETNYVVDLNEEEFLLHVERVGDNCSFRRSQ